MLTWIVEVGEPLPGIDAGAREWRAAMLARALTVAGHDVVWWAATFDHATKRHRFDGFRAVTAAPRTEILCLHGPGYATNRSPRRIVHHLALARAFAREAPRRRRPDVVFCCLPSLELADQAVRYGRSAGVPVVIDVRDLWPDHYLTLVPAWARGAARVALTGEFRRVKRLMAGATGITAISNAFLGWALTNAGRPQRDTDGVFPMGYPVAPPELAPAVAARRAELAARLALDGREWVLTFVGTFVSSFDLETVLAAARVLADEPFRFLLVGNGDDEARLKSLAAGLRNVTFTGRLDQTSIHAVLQLSSAGSAPYRGDASMSLPNKPYEYMSEGLPIVSSLRGELDAMLAAEGIGVQYRAGDVASLVEALRGLAADPERRRAMAARARALFERRFRADVVYSQLTRHLERIGRA